MKSEKVSLKSLKTIILVSLLTLTYNCFSQKTSFGLTGGYLNAYARVTDDNGSASTSDSGFYLGAFTKVQLNDKLFITPEINYGSINGNGFGYLSVRGGYYIFDKLNVQVGPQISYLLESTSNEVKSLGFDVNFGLGYDITEKFNIHAKYAFETSNRARDVNSEFDLKARFDWLFVGIGYTF